MSSSNNTAAPVLIQIIIPADLAFITGPQLLGLYFNWGLLGILSTQVYIYYLCFPKGPLHAKFLVYGLYILEVLQIAMISHDGFQWLVAGWGRPDALLKPELTWFGVPFMAGLISGVVQIFFAWRIYILGKSKILSGIIVFLALVQASSGIAAGIEEEPLNNVAELGKIRPAGSVWLAGSAAVDIIIAVSMVYLLTRAKGIFLSTNYLLTRLVRLTIETGSLTAALAIADVILFNVFPENNLHMCPSFILAKLYSNTLLVIFNQRIFIAPAAFGSNSTFNGADPGAMFRARLGTQGQKVSENRTSPIAYANTFGDATSDQIATVDITSIAVRSQAASTANFEEQSQEKIETDTV